jgi:polyribonucleotide nucleotidyltransferase
VIVIVGKKENAEKAKAMILAVEKQLANVTEETIEIPHKHHNSIIGPKGQLIRSVMEDYAVRISFPPSGSSSNEVKISGPREEVQKAKVVLEEMASVSALEGHSTELRVRPEYHRFLIGRNGTKIKKVREEFGVRVIFPRESGDGDQDVIAIIGRKEKTEAAKAHLQKMVEDLEKVIEDDIAVDPKYHRHFIQRRGQVIREISDENGGVIISFPKQGSDSDRVTLKGAKDCIESAKSRIKEIIEDLDAQVTLECVIAHTHHRSVLGNRGANIQRITEQWSVNVKFPDRTQSQSEEEEGEDKPEVDPRDVIVITGRNEHCEGAKEALLALVPVNVEVDVPNDYHRYIIGQRGREVRALMDEFEVQITIPSLDDHLDFITVTGPPSRVEAAKKAIEQKVQQLDAEKQDRDLRSYKEVMEVDSQYHPRIIGKKGATIDKIRKEHDVQIQFPDREGPTPNAIEITGYEHQAKAARDAIMKIVEELEEQITVEVEIDHRVHSRLIGQRGKAIAKVMEQYKVDIRFPKDKGTDIVTVTGLEENVMDARDEILSRADDFMEDVRVKEEEKELQKMYTRGTDTHRDSKQGQRTGREFKVRDAPWQNKDSIEEEFPAMPGGGVDTPATKWQPPTWGPKRKF